MEKCHRASNLSKLIWYKQDTKSKSSVWPIQQPKPPVTSTFVTLYTTTEERFNKWSLRGNYSVKFRSVRPLTRLLIHTVSYIMDTCVLHESKTWYGYLIAAVTQQLALPHRMFLWEEPTIQSWAFKNHIETSVSHVHGITIQKCYPLQSHITQPDNCLLETSTLWRQQVQWEAVVLICHLSLFPLAFGSHLLTNTTGVQCLRSLSLITWSHGYFSGIVYLWKIY